MFIGVSFFIGKIFVCVNLVVVISQMYKWVLLIDCDMCKGYIYELFGINNVDGLFDILVGKGEIVFCVKFMVIVNFDFILCGQVLFNLLELLMSECFGELIVWVSSCYDLVLIDMLLILVVMDVVIVGCYVGMMLMVVCYVVNILKEVEISLSCFDQNGIQVKGVIFNFIFCWVMGYQDYGYYEYEYQLDFK